VEDYNGIQIHQTMLKDRVRCEAFQRALSHAIHPGDIVVDVGAGTGILSLFAAQAGAEMVYAIERADIVHLARQIIHRNGYSDRIQIIEGDVNAVDLPCKVNVIVSEWFGSLGVNENLLPPVLLARDRWLKADGIMLPEKVTAWLAPISYERLEQELDFWHTRPYGVDLSIFAEVLCTEPLYECHDLLIQHLMAPPRALWTTDAYACSLKQANYPFSASKSFQLAKSGTLSGLAGWFHADLGNGVTLSNAPDSGKTHWGRIVFPIYIRIDVEANKNLEVEFLCYPTVNGYCTFEAALTYNRVVYRQRWKTPNQKQTIGESSGDSVINLHF
jgi:Predicted RNA methylase